MSPRNFLNGKERSSGASLFLRLAQSASIEEALEDLAEIAAEKGILLYSFRIKRGRLEHEFKPPNAGAVAGMVKPKLSARVTAVRLRSWGESFNLGFGFFLDPGRSGSSLSGF